MKQQLDYVFTTKGYSQRKQVQNWITDGIGLHNVQRLNEGHFKYNYEPVKLWAVDKLKM